MDKDFSVNRSNQVTMLLPRLHHEVYLNHHRRHDQDDRQRLRPTQQQVLRLLKDLIDLHEFSAHSLMLARAKALGYELKIHADQLSPSGGAKLAAELGAISADHLDHADDDDLDRLRDAGVVATLLPGCSYSLRSPYPSARRFIDRGLHVALATDFNPGTSYCENMQMILSLAMSSMDMSIEEALQAVTINGARALALHEIIGSIEVGKRCELALWSIRDYHEIGYHFGVNLIQSVLIVS